MRTVRLVSPGRLAGHSHLRLVGHPDEPFLCPLGLRGGVIELISLDGQEPQLRIITISSWFSHGNCSALTLCNPQGVFVVIFYKNHFSLLRLTISLTHTLCIPGGGAALPYYIPLPFSLVVQVVPLNC